MKEDSIYRTVLENISDAIFLADRKGKLIYVYGNVKVIFGHTKDELKKHGNINKILIG